MTIRLLRLRVAVKPSAVEKGRMMKIETHVGDLAIEMVLYM